MKLIKAFLGFLKLRTIGVPVIIIDKNKRILLGKRKKNTAFYPEFWGLPGGILKRGEKLTDCAKRETREELGIDVQITKQSKKIYEIFPSKEYPFHTLAIVFYTKIIKGTPKPKDETQEIKWFKLSEIKKMKLAYNHNEILKKEGLTK